MKDSETLDAPLVSGSPGRLQACPPGKSVVLDETEPRLICPLVDDEDPSGKDGRSTDTFYSARSTPGGEDRKVRQARKTKSKSPKGFVERIHSSGSEDNKPQSKPTTPIRETIEVDDDDDDEIMSTRERQSVSSRLFARPSPKGPRYDGVYRFPSKD